MDTQEILNYNRVAEAITYIRQNFRKQPSLEEVAERVHLSEYHFQRLFSEWAGTSPKKFLQYISIGHAKKLLAGEGATLSDAAYETGLSGTGRLHDLFVRIEGMTPAEYKNGGKSLAINYSFAESPFGNLVVASTAKGICYMSFYDTEESGLQCLQQHFPNASYSQKLDAFQQAALYIFQNDWSELQQIKLHLKGTPFQLKVWETLLKIPMGQVSTYDRIARQVEHPGAARAVGTAVGSNPVAYIIPCHRVIKASGKLEGYAWGTTRKAAMIGWEGCKQ
jgi:AraC family transcriptional regulator of adaptative response/methylated-DNA-[protein]-cysteine methyltransferase